jgi:hypothetical protein
LQGYGFYRKRILPEFLLPTLLLALLAGTKYYAPWHEGAFILHWIFCIWISHSLSPNVEHKYKGSGWVAASTAIVLGIQIFWGIRALRAEILETYSGLESVANFIKQNNIPVDSFYSDTYYGQALSALVPNIQFINQDFRHRGYWLWSSNNGVNRGAGWSHKLKASYLLSSGTSKEIPNFRWVQRFDGQLLWKGLPYEDASYSLQKSITAVPPTTQIFPDTSAQGRRDWPSKKR